MLRDEITGFDGNHIFVIKIPKAVKMFGLDPDPEPKEIFTDPQNWSF